MKYLLLILSFLPLLAWAQGIDESVARKRAVQFFQKNCTDAVVAENIQLAYTAKDNGETCFYVFNNGDSGFVMIGGDEAARKVLGYSDSGAFSIDSVPTNIRWWLAQYARQISNAKGNANVKSSAETRRKDIPNMISARWNQYSPYNYKLPRLSWLSSPYDRLATGCVATAAAQVMRYWKYPERGIGNNAYRLFFNYRSIEGKPNFWIAEKKDHGGSKMVRFSADFSKSRYLWDSMIDTYDEASSSQQKQAVATLMSDIGIASNMLYGQAHYDGSASHESALGMALIRNFGYSRNINIRSRNCYSDDDWEELVYAELSAGRPVIYGGYEEGNGGHEFVVSGYNATHNTFYINWGWGGHYNGHFALTAVVGQCSGATDLEQSFIQNVEPDKGDMQRAYISINGFALSSGKVLVGTEVNIIGFEGVPNSGYLTNNACCDVKTDLGVRLVDKTSGKRIDIVCDRGRELQSGYMTDLSFTPMEEGTFIVIPIYKSGGEWCEAPTNISVGYPTIVVTAAGFSGLLILEQGFAKGNNVMQEDMNYRVSIRNYGDKCTRKIAVFIGEDKQSGKIASVAYMLQNVDFEAGETKEIIFDRSHLKDADKLKAGKNYTLWAKVLD